MLRVFGDEVSKMKVAYADGQMASRALLRLVQARDPKALSALATYDLSTDDSSLWDDLTTPAVESAAASPSTCPAPEV